MLHLQEEDYYVLVANSDQKTDLKVGETLEVIQKLKSWLNPTEYDSDSSEYRKHLNAHVFGTGQWIYQTNQYKRWHDTDEVGDLWIRSVPGAGKSVAAADLIRQLKEKEDVPVLYFFFRQIIVSNRTPRSFLQDVCCQLLDHSPQLQSALKSVKEEYSRIDSVPFVELFRIFSDGLISMEKVYCILDAMDEMDLNEETFISDMLNLGRQYKSSIKLALTSRQLPYLEALFKGSSLVDLRLDRINVDQDIAKYIDYKLDQVQTRIDLDDAKSIKKTICEKGQGLFLYARLMMDECIRDPNRFLSSDLPGGLGEMYSSLLAEHASRSGTTQEFQSLVLGFVTHCRRPLRLMELTSVIKSMPHRGGLLDSQDTKMSIRSCCGPLLEVCEDEIVQIIHHSLTEFLTGSAGAHVQSKTTDMRRFPVLDSYLVHGRIAIACVNYLMSGCFQKYEITEPCTGEKCSHHNQEDCHNSEGGSGWDRSPRKMSLKYNFAMYAIRNWTSHASKTQGSLSEALFEAMDIFLHPDNQDFHCWLDLWPGLASHVPQDFHPLHVAAHCGIGGYVQRQLHRGVDANITDAFQRTPLMYAALQGHNNVAESLVSSNARLDFVDITGLTAVHFAAKMGHADVLQTLLDSGCDPLLQKTVDDPHWNKRPSLNSDAQKGKTALRYICQRGHVKALQVILTFIASEDINQNSLFWAVRNRQADIVRILLKGPGDINRKYLDDATAVFYAAKNHDPAIVRMLLNAGADPNITCDVCLAPVYPGRHTPHRTTPTPVFQINALQACAGLPSSEMNVSNNKQDTLDVVEMLIDAGCDVNAKISDGRTALFCWNSGEYRNRGHREAFVSYLLKRGADARVLDDLDSSVLHSMGQWHSKEREAVTLLVKAGANINQQRKGDGRTPLICAMHGSRLPDLTLFHDMGAEFDIQDSLGNTALHYVCCSSSMTQYYVDHWLKYSRPDIKNHAGRLPLSNFEWGYYGQECVAIIAGMVQKGVDIESRDVLGRTLLLQFICKPRSEGVGPFVTELLALGADAKAVDFEGKSALHHLVTSDVANSGGGDTTLLYGIMKQLVDAGSDINARDHLGRSIAHAALSRKGTSQRNVRCRLEAIEKLGGEIHTTDSSGRTAIHTVAMTADGGWLGIFDGTPGSRLDFVLDTDSGFDVNAKDNHQITPLHLGAEVSAINVWKMLQAGADLTAKDYIGRNVLHYAARAGQSDVVDLLVSLFISHKLAIDACDLGGRTPLHNAAQSGKLENIQSLLDAGASVKVLDRKGRSPLHHAAQFRSTRTIGFSPEDEAECLHKTTSHYVENNSAATSGNTGFVLKDEKDATQIQQVVRLLLASGADLSVKDVYDHTAYSVAVMHESYAVINELAPHMHLLHSVSTRHIFSVDPLTEQIANSRHQNLKEVIGNLTFGENNVAILKRIFSCEDESVVEALVDNKVRLIEDDGSSAIHLAVRFGKINLVRKLLSHVPDINAFSPPLLYECVQRETTNIAMLQLLIELGAHVDARRKKAEQAKSIYAVDDKISTTLGSAIIHILATGRLYWYPKALTVILAAGANTDVQDGHGMTGLRICLSERATRYPSARRCAGFWSDHVLDIFLEHGVDVNKPLSGGLTALSVALKFKRGREVLQKLIERGADYSAGSDPAIALAINAKDLDMLKMLLEAGVDPNSEYEVTHKVNYESHTIQATALYHAAIVANYPQGRYDEALQCYCRCKGQEDMITLLLQHGANSSHEIKDGKSTVLREIVASGGVMTASMLQGADLGRCDEQGMTALHWACKRSQETRSERGETAALILIQNGADVNALDEDGNTPLHYAVRFQPTSTVQALLARGANAHVKNNKGFAPLQGTFTDNDNRTRWDEDFDSEHVESLLEAGADPLARGPKGITLLHEVARLILEFSVMEGYDDYSSEIEYVTRVKALYRRLIALGCDPNAEDDEGNTPIFAFVTATKHYNECALESPPDPLDQREMFALHDIFKVNKAGDGLLHVVAMRDEPMDGNDMKDGLRLWEMLVDLGLDPRLENAEGNTPLDVAAAYKNKLILDLYARKD